MAFSMEQLLLLIQDDQNEVQHDFLVMCDVMPLALTLVSHDTNAIINDTTVFFG